MFRLLSSVKIPVMVTFKILEKICRHYSDVINKVLICMFRKNKVVFLSTVFEEFRDQI